MISSKKFSRVGRRCAQALLSLAVAGLLAACGGGGSDAGTPIFNGGTDSGTPGQPITDTAVLTIGLSSSTVTAGAPATVTVTVKNKSGSPLPGQVVKFSSDANLAAFSAPSALTDGNGVASVILSPAVSTATGADLVKATVKYIEKDYAVSAGFQLTATNVTIASFTSDVSGTLSAYGQANLTVSLAGTSSSSPVNLVLTSSCTSAGKGTLTPASQTTSTGRATFTFRDGGCGAAASAENLQVSVTGTALTQSLSLPISSPAVASIGFVSATPTNIFLRGSGYVENSNVVFQVKDANNNGVPEQEVDLEASVLVGGLTLDGGTAVVTKRTDKSGNVIVRINSGTVPTPVRIKATLKGSVISTVSSSLAIAVGLPSQLNFSFAQGTRNIEGYSIQGTPNTYSIIASDRLGNQVPDGTAINFVSEGGQVEAIKQTALNGKGIATATANFASAAPTPVDGRITVVAYALGEKSFLDENGNNIYDTGELFQDLGDIYLDRKYDAVRSKEDQYVSLSLISDNKACEDAKNPLLDLDVSIPVVKNTCSGKWGRAYVRRALQTILSTSDARPLWGQAPHANAAVGVGGNCPAEKSLIVDYSNDIANTTTFYHFNGSKLYDMPEAGLISFTAADANPIAYNPMAAGTLVSATGTEGLTVSVVGGSPVPNTSSPSGVVLSYKFDPLKVKKEGTITVSFTSPSGLTTTSAIFVSTETTIGLVCKVPLVTSAPGSVTVPKDASYTYAIGGGVSPYTVSTNDEKIATAVVSGSFLIIKGVAASGSTSIVINDSNSKSVSVTVEGAAPGSSAVLAVSPLVLSIKVGDIAGSFTVTGGVAPYTATSNNSTIATVTPILHVPTPDKSYTFKATALIAGVTTILVADAKGQVQTVTLTVN